MYWPVRMQNNNNNIHINILYFSVILHSVLGNNFSFLLKSVFMGDVFALINTKQVGDQIIIAGSLEDRCFSQISK